MVRTEVGHPESFTVPIFISFFVKLVVTSVFCRDRFI
jgi:hypothetical protein